jgi:hypothetical protein
VNWIRFEWDPEKNLANQRKHEISFQLATRVFKDPLFVSIKDRIVDGEQRWQTFGKVGESLILMVAHTSWEEDADVGIVEVIRVISAREATRRERESYEIENR